MTWTVCEQENNRSAVSAFFVWTWLVRVPCTPAMATKPPGDSHEVIYPRAGISAHTLPETGGCRPMEVMGLSSAERFCQFTHDSHWFISTVVAIIINSYYQPWWWLSPIMTIVNHCQGLFIGLTGKCLSDLNRGHHPVISHSHTLKAWNKLALEQLEHQRTPTLDPKKLRTFTTFL